MEQNDLFGYIKKSGEKKENNINYSYFYTARLQEYKKRYRNVKYVEQNIPLDNINKIFCSSSESMKELPKNSVHLVITSPPYNIGKEHGISLKEYMELTDKVWKECYRVLVPGGRICVVISNTGRKPYIPLHNFVMEDMGRIGFIMMGEIVWIDEQKDIQFNQMKNLNQWFNVKSPSLRESHQYILVFCKNKKERDNPNNRKITISEYEYFEFTKTVWELRQDFKEKEYKESFPVPIPYRLIQLYSFKDEVVLDPFIGFGTTAIAALKAKRKFVGYEIDEMKVMESNKRIEKNFSKQIEIDF